MRILSFDLARGLTVLFIPLVHATMLYASPDVHSSAYGKLLQFMAEWPGAQLFMLLMGINFVFSKYKTLRQIFIRAFLLILTGYLLNFLKFVIPLWLDLLPAEFLEDMHATSTSPSASTSALTLLLTGDILQFAGISLIILGLLQLSRDPLLATLLLAICICFASPFPFSTSDLLLQLFIGQPPGCFFPIFPWLIYPLAGYVIGHIIKDYGNKIIIWLLPAGLTLCLSAFCGGALRSSTSSFYVTNHWDTLMHLGFVIAWLGLFELLTRILRKPPSVENMTHMTNLTFMTYMTNFLSFLSRNISLIYLIQWPLVFWLLPVFGYQQLDTLTTIVIGIDILLLTLLITIIIRTIQNKNVFHQKDL